MNPRLVPDSGANGIHITRHTAYVLGMEWGTRVMFPDLPPVRTLDTLTREEVDEICNNHDATAGQARFEFRL